MEALVTPSLIAQQRQGENWLQGVESDRFWAYFSDFQTQFAATLPTDILIVEPVPERFLGAFLAAQTCCCRIWLANPTWRQQEWAQVATQCQPDYVIGNSPLGQGRSPLPPPATSQILIPTGGSSGNIRFAVHTWSTLTASVQGFQQHFGDLTIHAYCVLPLHHVSGLMQAVRCWLSGGSLVVQSFPALMQTGAIAPLPTPAFLSLVPTQLQRLLKGDRTIILWLQSFTAILLGGAPAGATLLDKARNLHLPLAPTYGMTETASQVATLLPQEFLAGNLSSGRILPHARLTIHDETGKPLPPFTPGRITLSGTSLAQGYGSTPLSQPWQSGDLGYLDSDGYLYVLGRENTLIITGGEKVLPAEVEAAILATSYASDVAVLGVPDQEWGEQVVAVVIPTHQAPLPPVLTIQLCAALKLRLSSYKIPKQWLLRKCLPRNAQGKLNQTELRQWVIQRLGSQPVANDRVPQAMDDVDG